MFSNLKGKWTTRREQSAGVLMTVTAAARKPRNSRDCPPVGHTRAKTEVHASIGQPVCITTGEQQVVVAEAQVRL
jgi:hypothetical protein